MVWNERARGLGITSETRRDISDVVFKDCDVIHDFSQGGDCAALAVLVSDSGTMRNIRFRGHPRQRRQRAVPRWVGKDMWGHDQERGHVDGVLLKDISVSGDLLPTSELTGCDAAHLIENVTFDNLQHPRPQGPQPAGREHLHQSLREKPADPLTMRTRSYFASSAHVSSKNFTHWGKFLARSSRLPCSYSIEK